MTIQAQDGNPFSVRGTDFRRQNLMSVDVRFSRLKSVPALKQYNIYYGRKPITSSSHTRLAAPEVKTIYWSGDFQERFFLFDPSLTSTSYQTRNVTCARVELMLSQRRRQWAIPPTLSWHFVVKLMNIQYLNHPPYHNRWMITLIQQGLGLRPREQRALLSGRCIT